MILTPYKVTEGMRQVARLLLAFPVTLATVMLIAAAQQPANKPAKRTPPTPVKRVLSECASQLEVNAMISKRVVDNALAVRTIVERVKADAKRPNEEESLNAN